jgi:hypothetical protein
MKKLVILFILTTLSLSALCQRSPVDDLFEKYNGKEGFTSVFISSKMFSLLARLDSEDKDFQNLVSRIKSIKILSIDSATNVTVGVNFCNELIRKLDASGFEELMTVKEKDGEVRFMIHEVAGKIAELVMITGGKGSSLVSISGDLDLKSIAELSDKMGMEELQDLEKVNQ